MNTTRDFFEEMKQIGERSAEEQKAFYKYWMEKEQEKTEVRFLAHYHCARLAYLDGDFRRTIEIMEPIVLDYRSYPFSGKLISCFNLIGVATHCEREYSVSRFYYRIALKLAQENEEKLYYSFEYNNIGLSYIAQKNYRDAMEYIRLAEEFLPYSDEEMGAYLYVNKATTLQGLNQMPEALEAYETSVERYHAMDVIPEDTMLCGATLFYWLGDKEKYESYKNQILENMNDMYAAEFMDACQELFECALDAGDDVLVRKILSSMEQYMETHPEEIKVGLTVADLDYIFANKLGDKDIILAALKQKNRYKEKIIRHSEQKRVQALEQSLKINEQLQSALESKEQAAQAKSRFLANMSHDIRTPINGIMGMLDMIRKTGQDPERLEDCLNKIEVSSKHLLSLVNDVLDMAKLENDSVVLARESFSLDEICKEAVDVVAFQAAEAGLQTTEEHDDIGGIHIWGSPLHLKKVLINLYSNSIKYNKPGGSIHTSMRVLSMTEDQMVCEFQIEDSGVGMSEEFIATRLFKPFVQAEDSSRSSYEGAGLGMSIVKQLVEKMGGSITVQSRLGEGSRFTVVLPLEIDRQADNEKEKENRSADLTGMCFLVAEDNELNMEIAEFFLTEKGARLDQAQNGQEAVEKFEAAKPGTYDAILMDLMMPVMDGLTAAKTIRALPRDDAKTIPIIAMTANAFAEDAEKCLAAGMNAHLAKPLDVDKAVETIRGLCIK